MKKTLILIALILFISCKSMKQSQSVPYKNLREKVQAVKDSISVGGMTIHNAFKFQILAHNKGEFDSLLILNNVYKPNQYVFDNCLGLIFGDDNGEKFKPNGLYNWNRKLLSENEKIIRQRIAVLDSVDINKLFEKHLTAIEEITEQKGDGDWMIYFGPKGFQIFGGCDKNAMVLDMFGSAWNTKSINTLFAHEIEHSIFEPILDNDPNGYTGLGITLDEGLAVYFTYIYLNKDIDEILFSKNTDILFEREKEIFLKLEPYLFMGQDEGCPIYRHCDRGGNCDFIIKDIPEDVKNTLCYFMGFRIIEKYVEKHGKESWKDIYKIPLKEFYTKSGYEEYIKGLK